MHRMDRSVTCSRRLYIYVTRQDRRACIKSATKEAPKPNPTIIIGTSPGWITPEGTKKSQRQRYSEVTPATHRVLCVVVGG